MMHANVLFAVCPLQNDRQDVLLQTSKFTESLSTVVLSIHVNKNSPY